MKEPVVLKWLRVILGLALLVFGANTFLQFMGSPEFNEAGGSFIGALSGSGYILPIMGVVFLLVGVLFVWGRYKPFAALLLLPFTVNIVLFHFVLDINGWLMGTIIFLINLWMLWAYRDKYESLFS